MSHASLTGAELHQPFHYIGENDPGAVGAGKTWFKKSIRTIYYRDDANLAWNSILASSRANALPSGTTATGIQAAINAASNGDIIVLPNETIIQDVPLLIDGKNVSLWGSGPASCLEHRGDITQFGSTRAIVVMNASNVEIAYFEIKANRAYTTASTRTIGIGVGEGTSNIQIHNMTFTGITSTCVLVQKYNTSAPISDIYFDHNTINEWYEQIFEVEEAGSGFYCCFNTAVTTQAGAWPAFGSVRPFGFMIAFERGGGGRLKNAICAYNSFDLSGLPDADEINSGAITLSDGDQDSVGLSWRYDNICIVGNYTKGGRAGVRCQRLRREGEPCTVYIVNNTFDTSLLEPIRFELSGYNMDDNFIIRGNRWVLAGGVTEGWNSADITALNLVAADNMAVGADIARDYTFNASDNDHLWSGGSNSVDGNNVAQWVEESNNFDWYEGAYSYNGVPLTANGPTYKTVTPLMALPCLAFNGSTEHMPALLRNSGLTGSFKTLDGVFLPGAKTLIMAIYVEGASANSASPWLNHGIFADNFNNFGVFVRNNGGTYKIVAYNWVGAATSIELTISLSTTYVVCVRHDGVNLYASLDGGAESSVASGPTATVRGRLILGANGGLTQFYQGRIGEIRMLNQCLSGAALTTAISTFTTKW